MKLEIFKSQFVFKFVNKMHYISYQITYRFSCEFLSFHTNINSQGVLQPVFFKTIPKPIRLFSEPAFAIHVRIHKCKRTTFPGSRSMKNLTQGATQRKRRYNILTHDLRVDITVKFVRIFVE